MDDLLRSAWNVLDSFKQVYPNSWYENVSFKGEEHMKRELYDFTTPPDSKGAHASLYYFPHNKQSSIGLQSRAPAYNEPPCMVANYDKEGNLLYTRFIFKDGTWRDD